MRIPFRSAVLILLSGCAANQPRIADAPVTTGPRPSVVVIAADNPRVDGRIGGTRPASAGISPGEAVLPRSGGEAPVDHDQGTIALDFTDTDIREVVGQILGGLLQANYTIDPGVRGTVTLRTANPLTRTQLMPALRVLLGQVGASLVQSDAFYRVVPNGNGGAGNPAGNGFTIVPLRFARSDELAKVLLPFVTAGGKLVADPASNTLLIGGDPDGRDALVGLARSFDIDAMAGQSYALFPVGAGEARGFATALQDALRGDAASSAGHDVKVVALRKVDAVLVVAGRPAGLNAARRIVALIDQKRRATVRGWRLYYMHNGRSNDVANFLQRAFTPNDVTAQATPERSGGGGGTAPGEATQSLASANASGSGQSGGGSTAGGQSSPMTSQPLGGSGGATSGGSGQSAAGIDTGQGEPGQDALMGSLGQDQDPDRMRIVVNKQNNAIAVYATQNETDLLEGMLRKIDIMPQQVRIDATVAEVTLNDSLQYGTQFFFRQGGLNGALASAFSGGAQGFFVAGNNSGAQAAIVALQAVTKVNVLSSPQLLVMDNQTARLQVGDSVPYLTSTSQSTITSGSPVITAISYRQTGVILDVTPRIGADGLVTLDIAQEVSDINAAITTPGINSPTFADRSVRTTIAIHDGQTVGLAGLIRDSTSEANTGFPFVKDIPVLGTLLGQQNNTRARTEMLILVTPHLVHDQREARTLTEELLEALPNAAAAPERLRRMPWSGASDPQAPVLRKLGLPR